MLQASSPVTNVSEPDVINSVPVHQHVHHHMYHYHPHHPPQTMQRSSSNLLSDIMLSDLVKLWNIIEVIYCFFLSFLDLLFLTVLWSILE